MKEIKFRAWSILDKKMLLWGEIFDLPAWEIFPGTPEQRAFEVMQFIGVYDKNGKEIYEGDIVQTYFSFSPGDAGYGVSQKPFIVDWNQEHASFRAKKPEADAGSLHLLDIISFFSMQSQLYEVIGNIYETPWMLEAKP